MLNRINITINNSG